jgi:hypothetical protein
LVAVLLPGWEAGEVWERERDVRYGTEIGWEVVVGEVAFLGLVVGGLLEFVCLLLSVLPSPFFGCRCVVDDPDLGFQEDELVDLDPQFGWEVVEGCGLVLVCRRLWGSARRSWSEGSRVRSRSHGH